MKYVILLSGGLDSTVLLWHLLDEGHQVSALSIDYGQRHRRELDAAAALAAERGVPYRVADLRVLGEFLAGSALTSDEIDVPHGHYNDESMKITVVPNRNMLMLSVAAAWAISSSADCIAYAAHSGDHVIYPDCRPEFVRALGQAIALADWRKVRLETPFLKLSKGDICKRGAALGAPLAKTWSCYGGGELHCGRCGTCVERIEAFQLAQVLDPTAYEALA